MVFKNTVNPPTLVSENTSFPKRGFLTDGFSILVKKRLLKNAKSKAKRERAFFKMGVFDFDLPQRCMFSGMTIDYNAPKRSPSIPTLYRLDPQKPYERGNVVVVSYAAAQSLRISKARTGLRTKAMAGPSARKPCPTGRPSGGAPPLLHAFLVLGRQALEEGWSPDRLELEVLRIYHAVKKTS